MYILKIFYWVCFSGNPDWWCMTLIHQGSRYLNFSVQMSWIGSGRLSHAEKSHKRLKYVYQSEGDWLIFFVK